VKSLATYRQYDRGDQHPDRRHAGGPTKESVDAIKEVGATIKRTSEITETIVAAVEEQAPPPTN